MTPSRTFQSCCRGSPPRSGKSCFSPSSITFQSCCRGRSVRYTLFLDTVEDFPVVLQKQVGYFTLFPDTIDDFPVLLQKQASTITEVQFLAFIDHAPVVFRRQTSRISAVLLPGTVDDIPIVLQRQVYATIPEAWFHGLVCLVSMFARPSISSARYSELEFRRAVVGQFHRVQLIPCVSSCFWAISIKKGIFGFVGPRSPLFFSDLKRLLITWG